MSNEAEQAEPALDGGGYELIRSRLLEQAKELRLRADALNERRRDVFGGSEWQVVGNERIRTQNNCVPRDTVMVAGHLLFGYNVFIGLKTETTVSDVLSLHRFTKTDTGWDVAELPGDSAASRFLRDPGFNKDFAELYRFYKSAKLVRLSRSETKLLAAFQIGQNQDDVRVFRWAVSVDGEPHYVDNRGERELSAAPQHQFEWTPTTSDDQVSGAHPHVSILDEVFVQTLGGRLTFKIEDNTETGEGIYEEPLDDPRQSLSDASFEYAKVGTLVLLRIKPYNEAVYRHFVYSTRMHTVTRIDALGRACAELPEDHGIVFPGGYYLQDGRFKLYADNFQGFEYERTLRSPNGEDVLFVFHQRDSGQYALFSYNLVQKELRSPTLCHGYSVFDDGRIIVLLDHAGEPTRVHQMRIWQTPFVSPEHAARTPNKAGGLGHIGNADLVRGLSDCLSIARAIEETSATRQIYEDLIRACTRTLDSYFWLGEEIVGDLAQVISEVRATAELVIGEFDKVVAIREKTKSALAAAVEQQAALVGTLRPESWQQIEHFMEALTSLRTQRGHLISLKDMRYVDLEAVSKLESEATQAFARVSDAVQRFLMGEKALTPLLAELDQIALDVKRAEKSAEVRALGEKLDRVTAGVNVLSEVIQGLKSDDPTVRTQILERVSEVFGQLNRTRGLLENQRRTLLSQEGRAEFVVQFQLFKQSVDGALGMARTPQACDEQLAHLMVQLEELEARFGEFDEFALELTAQREDLHGAFAQKKQQMLDERQRRADNTLKAAERILQSLSRRSKGFDSVDALNGFFASDPMTLKLSELVKSLAELGDPTKAGELESRLKTVRQEGLRALRDRQELFVGGENLIKLGRHQFEVNTQPKELTVVPHGNEMALAFSGTDFRERIRDEEFLATRSYWTQSLVSETKDVYRGEYLAGSLLLDALSAGCEGTIEELRRLQLEDGGLLALVRKAIAERYDEGYERGIHDHDASVILDKLLLLQQGAGLLAYEPSVRVWAWLFWVYDERVEAKRAWQRRAQSIGRLQATFRQASDASRVQSELASALGEFATEHRLGDDLEHAAQQAAAYLVSELATEKPRFCLREQALVLVHDFYADLERRNARQALRDDLEQLSGHLRARFDVAESWLTAYAEHRGEAFGKPAARLSLCSEAVGVMLTETHLERAPSSAQLSATLHELVGTHPRIERGSLTLSLDEFVTRLSRYRQQAAPGFVEYRKRRHELVEKARSRLGVDELLPNTLSSFVRNRLINEVYLPLIGDNFAKQLGAAGDTRRTDLMGLLLLISPPGYGKTTLMEYLAARLGLVFMKVNGPALGHSVTSLDPAQAPNSTSRQEVMKINLALEMGNNVMLYLDDIQHTNPELLQKFISLCDAQRRIEGVWGDQTRTYDLRGKRFCVVMAGNPYTESGERFRIPDMLSNRADTYNLGDILQGKDDVFALSYIENAITSNPTLSVLASREQADVYALVKMAEGRVVQQSEFSHDYASVELDEMVAVLKSLLVVQKALLKVNQAYIASASTDDRFRTEPPFKLQGSYRNMAKLAEKVVSVMQPSEIESLLVDHYRGEAQTLTTEAESNLLKLKELLGVQSDEERERYQAIKSAYVRSQRLGGAEEDPVTRVTRQLSDLTQELSKIHETLSDAVGRSGMPPGPSSG